MELGALRIYERGLRGLQRRRKEAGGDQKRRNFRHTFATLFVLAVVQRYAPQEHLA